MAVLLIAPMIATNAFNAEARSPSPPAEAIRVEAYSAPVTCEQADQPDVLSAVHGSRDPT